MRSTLLALLLAFFCAAISSPVQAQVKPEVKYAQVGDIKMAYYVRGQGKPLLMINGFLASMSLWDPTLLEVLEKRHQLILFDNRGIGLSTDTKENNTTIPQMADDAAGLIKSLGLKKANVLAYSMGARIGQQLVIRHPDLVEKLVLCAPNPGGKYQDPAAKDVEATLNNPSVPFPEKAAFAFSDDAAGRLAAKACLGRINAAKLAGTIPDDFNVPRETTLRQDRARMELWSQDNGNFEALKNVKVPVLVTDGQYDIIDRPKNSIIVANQIPFAWLAFFEGGHAFLFQQAEKFSGVVNVFLE